ncbi:uncharacterized protein LOC133795649 [Humulus lupulus]|uniref:uncharacterized protein LOC133795649 n=1 Tax=Humulus lupulus TaxID=3486 RepID=UPI002B409741|nr:uncharacterized protein LOC133795649 [Humulus lupulus]
MDNNRVNKNGDNDINNNQPAVGGAELNPMQRAVRDFCMPVVNENLTGIANPAIGANNFELKPALINMVQQNQFGGLATEDPNIHLAIFLEVCAIVKMNGVTDDAIRLRLFPFSLRDRARRLNAPIRTIVDAARGALLAKTANEAFTLMEEMATNHYQRPNERSGPRKVVGLYEVDQMTVMHAQIAALQT